MRTPLAVTLVALALAGAPEGALAKDKLPPVQSVAVGDFDGDGVRDVAVGLPEQKVGKLKEAGEIRLYSGKDGTLLWKLSGRDAEDGLGEALAAVGDTDGDGATDLAVGRPYSARSGFSIHSGKTGKSGYFFPSGSAIGLGSSLCALGDGSGKKRVDLMVTSGRKWYFAYTDKVSVGTNFPDPAGYLSTTTWIGDLNGDREPDFAVGAWSDGPSGKIRIYSSKPLDSGPLLLEIEGATPGEGLGLVLAPVGDWNDDGKPDVLAGTAGNKKRKRVWKVRILSGEDGSELWSKSGEPGDIAIGGIVLLGDINDDDKPDIAIGTPGRNRSAGALSVVSGEDGAVLWVIEGGTKEMMAEELYPAGDANGDGTPDLVVVSPGAKVKGKKGLGYVRIVSGKDGADITLINPLKAKKTKKKK